MATVCTVTSLDVSGYNASRDSALIHRLTPENMFCEVQLSRRLPVGNMWLGRPLTPLISVERTLYHGCLLIKLTQNRNCLHSYISWRLAL